VARFLVQLFSLAPPVVDGVPRGVFPQRHDDVLAEIVNTIEKGNSRGLARKRVVGKEALRAQATVGVEVSAASAQVVQPAVDYASAQLALPRVSLLEALLVEAPALFREILHLIAQGHPNRSIARQLSLSTKTVGNYVSNIFTKLQVADRAQAIIRAREADLG
jgi:DNA-binding NarL/FixJ family response regulator